jgi:hypothetical protein
MIDRFDAGFDEPPPPAPATGNSPPPPRGECVVRIVKAERKAVRWRASPGNPRGDCISLRLAVSPGSPLLFVDLPDDKPWLMAYVARAVGIDRDLCVPEELTGKLARVEIDHYTARDGRPRAVVKRWLPTAPSRRPAAPGATATLNDAIDAWRASGNPRQPPKQSRNACPRYGAADDLPF